jgi:hypothetical protein
MSASTGGHCTKTIAVTFARPSSTLICHSCSTVYSSHVSAQACHALVPYLIEACNVCHGMCPAIRGSCSASHLHAFIPCFSIALLQWSAAADAAALSLTRQTRAAFQAATAFKRNRCSFRPSALDFAAAAALWWLAQTLQASKRSCRL